MVQSKDIDWPSGFIKRYTYISYRYIDIYDVYKRLTADLKTQTGSEGIEKGIPCKWKKKKAEVANNTYIMQNKL